MHHKKNRILLPNGAQWKPFTKTFSEFHPRKPKYKEYGIKQSAYSLYDIAREDGNKVTLLKVNQAK